MPVLLFSHPAWLAVTVGAAAVLGHMFSPYVHFKGGKGVATAAGMFLALAPVAVLIAIVIAMTIRYYQWMPAALFLSYLLYGFLRPFLSRRQASPCMRLFSA